MPLFPQIRCSLLLLAGLVFSLSVHAETPPYECQQLPSVMQAYLKQVAGKASVLVRPDCLAVVEPGYTYIPVLPQQLPVLPPTSVVKTWPKEALAQKKPAELVQFDHNHYLLRLLPTQSGKLTFPRLDAYPDTLKLGLLPQNFVLPQQLAIPNELKILLGDLPYEVATAQDAPQPALRPLEETLANWKAEASQLTPPLTAGLYIANLDALTLSHLEPRKGQLQWSLLLPGVATAMLPFEAQGKLLLNVLHKPEALIVDANARLIQRHLDLPFVAQRFYRYDADALAVVSYTHKPLLTVLDMNAMLPLRAIPFNDAVQAVALRQRVPLLYVLEDATTQVLEVDLKTGNTLRRLQPVRLHGKTQAYQKNVQQLLLQETPIGFGWLWLWDERSAQLQRVSIASGQASAIQTLPKGSRCLGLDASKQWLLFTNPATQTWQALHCDTFYQTPPLPTQLATVSNASPLLYTQNAGWWLVDYTQNQLNQYPTRLGSFPALASSKPSSIPLQGRVSTMVTVGLGLSAPEVALALPETIVNTPAQPLPHPHPLPFTLKKPLLQWWWHEEAKESAPAKPSPLLSP